MTKFDNKVYYLINLIFYFLFMDKLQILNEIDDMYSEYVKIVGLIGALQHSPLDYFERRLEDVLVDLHRLGDDLQNLYNKLDANEND